MFHTVIAADRASSLVDVVDAVGGEPDLRPGKESSSRRALLIVQRFCVGEPCHASPRPTSPDQRPWPERCPAVDQPPAAITDPAVLLPSWVDEAAFAEAEPGQVSADSSLVDRKTDTHKWHLCSRRQDSICSMTPCWVTFGRTPVRTRRPVLQSRITV